MRLVSCLPMTSDRVLAGDCPKRQWDLSFLDSDSDPFPGVDSPPPQGTWSCHKIPCSRGDGVWKQPNHLEQSGRTLDSTVARYSNCTSPHPLPCPNCGKTFTCAGKTFHLAGGDLTMAGGGKCCACPERTVEELQPHIYQNGGGSHAVDTFGCDGVLVDSVSRVTVEDNSRFFFPVVHSPQASNATTPRTSVPWLTVAPSGSETDTESRSQSISSQDSSDQENLRVKDDSGIGMVWAGEVLPRRNSSAPALNDLSVVVCRPSPSPIVEFPHEPLTPRPHPKRTDNAEESARVNCLLTADAPCHDAYTRVARFLPSWDLERLSQVFLRLNMCRFYLGKVTFDDAKVLLKGYPVGTFLLRDSSDSRFLFSLSVQTTRGTTSIRVIYEAGHFRLDCESEQVYLMPTFDCVIRLIQHYSRLASTYTRQGLRNNFVFLESSGRKDTPVLLRKPYANRPASLKHICRLRINDVIGNQSVDRLQLIPSLKAFIKDYPYDI